MFQWRAKPVAGRDSFCVSISGVQEVSEGTLVLTGYDDFFYILNKYLLLHLVLRS